MLIQGYVEDTSSAACFTSCCKVCLSCLFCAHSEQDATAATHHCGAPWHARREPEQQCAFCVSDVLRFIPFYLTSATNAMEQDEQEASLDLNDLRVVHRLSRTMLP